MEAALSAGTTPVPASACESRNPTATSARARVRRGSPSVDLRETSRDVETGVASCGETRAEALALHEGGGEPIEDEDAFLEEIELDPSEVKDAREAHEELPEFLQ
ncbi:MAG: hypothetical protein ABEH88_06455 [Halobacteriales archaeon]